MVTNIPANTGALNFYRNLARFQALSLLHLFQRGLCISYPQVMFRVGVNANVGLREGHGQGIGVEDGDCRRQEEKGEWRKCLQERQQEGRDEVVDIVVPVMIGVQHLLLLHQECDGRSHLPVVVLRCCCYYPCQRGGNCPSIAPSLGGAW